MFGVRDRVRLKIRDRVGLRVRVRNSGRERIRFMTHFSGKGLFGTGQYLVRQFCILKIRVVALMGNCPTHEGSFPVCTPTCTYCTSIP